MAANPEAIVMTAMDGKPVIVITGLDDDYLKRLEKDVMAKIHWAECHDSGLAFCRLHGALQDYNHGKRTSCK